MGTGMGCASIGIYSYELIHMYGVENLIRIGSCGAMQEDIELGEIIMAAGASTDTPTMRISISCLARSLPSLLIRF